MKPFKKETKPLLLRKKHEEILKPTEPESPGEARGLIRTKEPQHGLRHDRTQPPIPLRNLIRHYWWVEWNLSTPSIQRNLPHPAVHLVFEEGEARIYGAAQGPFRIELHEQGWVFGVKFQPGAFYSILQRPVASLSGRVIPAAKIFPEEIRSLNEKIIAAHDMERRAELASEFMLKLKAHPDEEALLASRLVHRLERERDLLRVEELCRSEGISLRSLQRLFRKYVGASPKWIICRFRLHEALARLEDRTESGTSKMPGKINWAAFALDLGYYDQAHFIKDFTAMVGRTPENYEKDRI